MDRKTRNWFDRLAEEVIANLPEMVRNAMDQEVPLYIEDHPPRKILKQMGIHDRRELWGLFTGIPISEKETWGGPPRLPDRVTIYREGLLWSALGPDGVVDPEKLKQQIRVTILHEYGHYFGMSEEELEERGYG